MTEAPPRSIPASLGLWDTVSIIVGIIVGVGIFSAPAKVFTSVAGPWEVLGVWALGGLLSLIGALCFAELASTYPRSGGEYVYLTRAYGPGIGFLFAWAQLTVIRTGGGIAAVAYIFGENANLLWGRGSLGDWGPAVYAVAGIVVLSLINILGAEPGKYTQNVLTVAKVLGIGSVVVAGFLAAAPVTGAVPPPQGRSSLALAMILVLYTYDGWNEASYVCGELRDCRRNIPRSLIIGTLLVTFIYLLYNSACLAGLGFAGCRQAAQISPAKLHEDVAALALGPYGGRAVLVLVMLCALGSVSGTIFTAARLYAVMGADHRLFAPLGRWNARLQTPAASLFLQAAISVAMVVAVTWLWPRGAGVDVSDGFEKIVAFTAPVFWLFFLLTGIALFVLRRTDPDVERPFQVPLYPLLPLIFCGWCGYMLVGSILYARQQALAGIVILLAGLPLYAVSRWLEKRQQGPKLPAPYLHPVPAGSNPPSPPFKGGDRGASIPPFQRGG